MKQKMHVFSLLLTVMLMLAAPTAQAQQAPAVINVNAGPEEQFEAARKAYDDGDITRAASLYEQLISQGFHRAEIYFNLGNACFRRGETGKAILCFKRALLQTPRDHDIQANLRFALENAGALVPKATLFTTLTCQATLNEWLVLALVFWWLLIGVLIIRLLRPAAATPANRLMLLFGLLLLLTLGAAGHRMHLRTQPEAVVTAKGQSALSAPLEGATPLFRLPEGSVVRVTDRSGQWVQVAAGPQSGWLRQNTCETVADI